MINAEIYYIELSQIIRVFREISDKKLEKNNNFRVLLSNLIEYRLHEFIRLPVKNLVSNKNSYI